jgi:AcrR family transcriptional regulator
MELTTAAEGEKRGSQDKRQRLLDAAGEVFAQRGFKAATIQEISQRANANIASVNYHFRDKESLYREVFRYALEQSRRTYLSYPIDSSEGRPAQRLKLELRRYLHNMFSPERAPWQAMMFFREMIEPTDVFDSLVNEAMRPYQKSIESLVREVVGPQAEEHVVRFSAFAAISLCSSFHTAQKYLTKLYPDERFSAESSDELADLITRFVLGGMRALKLPPK